MAKRTAAPDIRAAGGVLWRRAERTVEVAVVHRPRYDDWSLPKGKLEAGETNLVAAVREVGEETGARVAASRRLREIEYPVGDETKRVAWWVMRHLGGDFAPSDEVDELRWLPAAEARSLLSYKIEHRVLDEFTDLPTPDAVVVLVRHAHAGKRSEWSGPDRERPLDNRGRRQAARLLPVLRAFAPDRVLSAEPVRCVETVLPTAAELGVDVEVNAIYGDHAFQADPDAAMQAVLRAARPGTVTVIASQGGAIPGVIDKLDLTSDPPATRKAAAWALSFVDGTVVSADYYDDAVRETLPG